MAKTEHLSAVLAVSGSKGAACLNSDRPVRTVTRRCLPTRSKHAICSYECTFCTTCVENVLENGCPNCGGGFVPRPIRPSQNWKGDNFLGKDPARTRVRHRGLTRKFMPGLQLQSNPYPPQEVRTQKSSVLSDDEEPVADA